MPTRAVIPDRPYQPDPQRPGLSDVEAWQASDLVGRLRFVAALHRDKAVGIEHPDLEAVLGDDR